MSLSNPKVSIIIPFYNRVVWVMEAVESAVNQTYKNIEIILVDDGSTENIDRILRIQDDRIRYYRQENKGVSSARNKGIELATGEYIAFLDSDDLFMPEKLELQLVQFQKYPTIGLVHSSYYRINEHGSIIQAVNTSIMSGSVFPTILYSNQIATPTVMIKNNSFIRSTRFLENIHVGEDILFWAKIAERYSIMGLENCLTKVRVNSISTSISIDRILTGNKNIMSQLPFFDTLHFNQKLIVKIMLFKNIFLLYILKWIDCFLQTKFNISVFSIIKNNPLLMKWFGKYKIVQFN